MKANELRIGNYVQKNGVQCTVEIINGETCEVYVLGKDFYSDFIVLDIQPIPLTEEWLLKFGFKISSSKHYSKDKLSIQFPIDTENLYPKGRTYFNSWCIINGIPKSIHQLQNLYFALTGEELTIKD